VIEVFGVLLVAGSVAVVTMWPELTR